MNIHRVSTDDFKDEPVTAAQFRRAAAVLYSVLYMGKVPRQFLLGWVTGINQLAAALDIDYTKLDLPALVDLGSTKDDPCGFLLCDPVTGGDVRVREFEGKKD